MPTPGLAIVYIHTGSALPAYLVAALHQARLTNPHSPLYLISDFLENPSATTNSLPPNLQHVSMKEHFEEAKKFEEVFFNLSINHGYFERFCMQRWFVLKSFMQRYGLSECFYCDSDVLIFCDVTSERGKFKECDYTISSRYTWGAIYINNPHVLPAFCDMTMEIYSRRTELWKYVCDILNLHNPDQKVGNMSDMTLVRVFAEKFPFKFLDTSDVIAETTFDQNINIPNPGFEMLNDRKKIYWVNGYPFGLFLASGQLVRFNVLHHQAGAKDLMVPTFTRFVSHITGLPEDPLDVTTRGEA